MNQARDIHSNATTLTGGSNALGFQLLPFVLGETPGKNVLLSPLSVSLALAMTYNGAEGATKEALAKAMALGDLSLEEVNAGAAWLTSVFQGLEPEVSVHLANSIWVRLGIEPAPDFVRRIEDVYDGRFTSVNFKDPETAEVINRWVARQTRDLIDQLVTPKMIESAIMVLVNALAFKGIWTKQFDEEKTQSSPFTLYDGSRKQHPLMAQDGRYDYLEAEEFQAVSLPYGEGRVSMIVVLPKPTISIEGFQEMLNLRQWDTWMSRFVEMEGEIALPRFKVAFEAELLPHLKVLGGEAIDAVDFLRMGAGQLFISKVIHKTFMEVNEEGTEAAAATAVIMARGLSSRFQMIVDRPFFCAIRDNQTGLILFMGWVLDPESG